MNYKTFSEDLGAKLLAIQELIYKSDEKDCSQYVKLMVQAHVHGWKDLERTVPLTPYKYDAK
jgi:hypothetical protein